jgi:hypothetical protein
MRRENGFVHASKAQRLLNDALAYWLFSSLSLKSAWWRRCHLHAHPLVKCAAALRTLGIPLPQVMLQPSGPKRSVIQYAQTLALFYGEWEQYLPRHGANRATIPKGKGYQTWLAEGGSNVRYWPIHALQALLGVNGTEFFERAAVHGSIATLDDTLGFSDMDLAFVVRTSVLKDPQKLLEFRKLAVEILTLTYAFDPQMHHGPHYVSAIDLGWYPEAMFPSMLFGYGVDLLDNSPELDIWVRPSNDVTDQILDMFERFFEGWPSSPFVLKDSHDLEWVLGSAMLLPALYLQQRSGAFHYKRDTFLLAEKDFSTEEWEPIRTASELRVNLGPRAKPSRQLVWLARRLQWPGVLQLWARRHPVSVRRGREATRVLGPDYPLRVLRLLTAMKSRIPKQLNKAVTKPDDDTMLIQPDCLAAVPTGRYFDDIRQGPFIDVPHKVPIERYDTAIELLVSHWSSLPRRPSAIYQIGQVSAPGISDIDFVLVFPYGKPIDWTQYMPQAFPDWVQQLITHPPYFCTEDVWSDLPAWLPTFNLRHLWGDVLPEPQVPRKFLPGCALGILVDYLIVKVPRDFISIACERPIRVRILLAMLHSLKYTVKLAEQAGFTLTGSARQVISEVDALRASWFDLEPSKRLGMLVEVSSKVCNVVGVLISQVDRRLLQTMGELDDHHEVESITQDRSSLFRFVAPWSFIKAMEMAFEYSCLYPSRIMWISPLSFSQVMAIYANEHPSFGRYLHANGYHSKLRWDGGIWNDGLRYHARAMMAYSQRIATLGVPAQKYIALGYSLPSLSWRSAQRYAMRILKREVSLRDAMRRIALAISKR